MIDKVNRYPTIWLIFMLCLTASLIPISSALEDVCCPSLDVESPILDDEIQELSISGTKFDDLNCNGQKDDGETGLPGWTIRLMHQEAEILSTTTDEAGYYSFNNLKPGKYIVSEDQVAGWNQTTPGSGAYEVTLTDKDGRGYNFGNYKGTAQPKWDEQPLN